jgi:hypothetical protein
MVQSAKDVNVAVPFEIEQPPLAVKLMARPELAVAERLRDVSSVWVPGFVKVMVCVCRLTANAWVTGDAAAKVELPPCEAVMEHDPEPLNDAVLPVSEQAPTAVKLTGKLELAVALRVSGVPASWAPGLAKVMVCVCRFTVNVCVTDGAAV